MSRSAMQSLCASAERINCIARTTCAAAEHSSWMAVHSQRSLHDAAPSCLHRVCVCPLYAAQTFGGVLAAGRAASSLRLQLVATLSRLHIAVTVYEVLLCKIP
jgi:hypothetical protein